MKTGKEEDEWREQWDIDLNNKEEERGRINIKRRNKKEKRQKRRKTVKDNEGKLPNSTPDP